MLGESRAVAAWAEGEAMTPEQAMAYALAEDKPAINTEPAATPEAGPLTLREREVAVLIARRLTNRQSAAELFISQGTAKRHVENILQKLGLATRDEVVAWAALGDAAGPPSVAHPVN